MGEIPLKSISFMKNQYLLFTVWPRKYAHSSFSSLVHSLLPKDTIFRTYFMKINTCPRGKRPQFLKSKVSRLIFVQKYSPFL